LSSSSVDAVADADAPDDVHNERKRFSSAAEAKHEQQLLLILIISKTLFLVAGYVIVVNHISFYVSQKARRQSFAELTFVRVM
jgi:hypothetical protein